MRRDLTVSRVCTDPGKSWRFVAFKVNIIQAWKVLESGLESPGIRPRSWKVVENCADEWKTNSCYDGF